MTHLHTTISDAEPVELLERSAPTVEAMLWHYAFGKPRDSLDVTVAPAGEGGGTSAS